MTQKKKNLSEYTPFTLNSVQNIRIGIVASEWNGNITDSLLKGAVDTLLQHGIKEENVIVHQVPGSFELAGGANMLLQYTNVDAVICIGCIIQGETRHFDFIAQATANGIMEVGLRQNRPVLFGVLTCNTMQQAEERAGGKHGNKGVEAAASCLKMIKLRQQISPKVDI